MNKGGLYMISASEASEIASRYYNDVYKVCLSELNDEDMASDVTQEVFLTFQKKLKELTYTEHIRAWLFSTARNKLHEQFRYIQKIRDNQKDLEDIELVEDPSILYDFDDYCYITDNEILSIKERILQKLSPDERLLFNEIYEKRRKYQDIALDLGINERAVSLRAFRLRQKLYQMIEIAFLIFVYLIVKIKS